MATRLAIWLGTPGQTPVYIYPLTSLAGSDYSLADWSTHRVELTEKVSPNTGRYQNTADDTKGYDWAVFVGSAQPSGWGENVGTVDLRNAAIVDEVAKIPRASAAVAAGAAVRRTAVAESATTLDESIGAVP